MDEDIPVTFTLTGKTYHGRLFKDHPAANNWNLNVGPRMNSWHFGAIYLSESGEWGFRWNHPELVNWEDYFVDVLIAWYE